MFGHEAAVKHTLLESERPKYLGIDDGMINLELMKKLYMVVAHNLNEARKVRDRKQEKEKHKGTREVKNRRQCTCQRSHIKSIPTEIQRFLHQ